MCGRFVIAGYRASLIDAFEVDDATDTELPPSWNIAPTRPVYLITERLDRATGETRRRLETARWGLIPSWARTTAAGVRMINARSETLTDKPSFRAAAARRRGLVPATGYYEWRRNADGTKSPIYLHSDDDGPLAFAGLYEFWQDKAAGPDSPWVASCTIITRAASDALGQIHERTPVIVPQELHRDWLGPQVTAAADVRDLLAGIPDPTLVPRLVGPEVGNVRNDGPGLIRPIDPGDS